MSIDTHVKVLAHHARRDIEKAEHALCSELVISRIPAGPERDIVKRARELVADARAAIGHVDEALRGA